MSKKEERVIDSFHKAAKGADLDYLIIGGFAASYWGQPRFTADIDYVIQESNLELSKKILESLNYKLVFLHPKKSFAHFALNQGSGFRIDFMIVDKETWQKLKSSSSDADFGGTEKYPIVSPLHLIAMKLHSAKQPDRKEYLKDLNDVAQIVIAQNLDLEDPNLDDIIKKYGTEKTISELKKLLKQK